jgi:hypothetical protein
MDSASQQLSQLIDGGSLSLRVCPIFSYVLSCFGLWLSGSVLTSFQSVSAFLTSGFLPCFLVDFLLFFMLERIGLRKLFTKFGCCRTVCSLLRGQVVICSQRS